MNSDVEKWLCLVKWIVACVDTEDGNFHQSESIHIHIILIESIYFA